MPARRNLAEALAEAAATPPHPVSPSPPSPPSPPVPNDLEVRLAELEDEVRSNADDDNKRFAIVCRDFKQIRRDMRHLRSFPNAHQAALHQGLEERFGRLVTKVSAMEKWLVDCTQQSKDAAMAAKTATDRVEQLTRLVCQLGVIPKRCDSKSELTMFTPDWVCALASARSDWL